MAGFEVITEDQTNLGKDAVGGHNATQTIGVTPVQAGVVGGAGKFTNGWVQLPETADLNLLSGDFTLSMFMKSSDLTNRNFFTKASPSAHRYGLSTGPTASVAMTFNGNAAYGEVFSNGPVFDGAWHHITGIKRGGIAEMWVDGVMQNTATITTNFPDDGGFAIGRDGECCEFFNGLMDEVKIWNRALSQTEIQAEINSNLGGAIYHFDDPLPLVDSSGAGNSVQSVVGATRTAGFISQAYHFSGNDTDRLVLPESVWNAFGNTAYFSAWVRPTTYSPNIATIHEGSYIFRKDAEENDFWAWMKETGALSCLIYHSGVPGDHAIATGGTIPLNVWSNVACYYDGTTMHALINGQEVATAIYPVGNISWFQGYNTTEVGTSTRFNDGFHHTGFTGDIDEIFIGTAPPPASPDTTAPVIMPNLLGTPGSNGWYLSSVTASWNVNDQESGIASTTGCAATTLTADTPGVQLTCSATNGAGLQNSATVSVKIDTTLPVVTANRSPNANTNGWNNTVVTVTFSGTDALSGIANCSAPVTVNSEGVNQSASGGCSDQAGNAGSAMVSGINFDKTPPVIAVTNIIKEATSSSGAPVTFAPSATDNLSGVQSLSCDTNSGATFPLGVTTVHCTATDRAVNSSAASFTVTVQDTTAPALTLPSNITAPLTNTTGTAVSFSTSALDIVDGNVPVTCTPASGSTFPLGTTTVNCSATDSHGNTAHGSFTVTVVFTGVGSAGNYAVLGLNNSVDNASNTTINGDVGVGANGSLTVQAPSRVNGNVYRDSTATVKKIGAISGSIFTQSMANALNDALNAATNLASFVPTQTFSGNITTNTSITGNGGLNVISVGGNINLNNQNLTLTGGASDIFVINVHGNLSLTGTAGLLISGGVQVKNVIYNFTGSSGSFTTHIGDTANGVFLAPNYNLSSLDGTWNGEIIGTNIALLSGATVTRGQ